MKLEQAADAVLRHLRQRGVGEPGGIALLPSCTIEKPYGWVFSYNSREYVETGNLMSALCGHGPVLIVSATGEIVEFGSLLPGDEQIQLFEKERGLSPR